MTNEERKEKYMNRNIKLFPPLLAITWDVLFVFTITTLFFHNQKGFSYSQIMMLESVLMLAGCVLCIPVTKLFAKVTPLNSTRIALLSYEAFLLLCIFGTNYFVILCGYLFLAFGYCVSMVKGTSLLTDSLSAVKRNKDFDRVYGRGLSYSYFAEAIGAVFVTTIYAHHPYLTFWISFGIIALFELYSFLFKEPSKFQEQNAEIEAKDLTKVEEEKPKKRKYSSSYLKLLSSTFVISILLYSFVFRGVVSIDTGAFKIYLQNATELNVLPIWAFGVIYGIMKICVSLSNKYQFKFNLKFGVRCLIIFNVLLVLTLFVNGLAFVINPYSIVTVIIIVISSCIQCSLRPPNFIFITNYMQVCMPKRDIEKMYAMGIVVQYLGYSIMTAIFSGLLNVFKDNYGYSVLTYLAISLPLVIGSTIFFIRVLCKKYAQKFTVIKPEYTED